jgi:hypothetical protein
MTATLAIARHREYDSLIEGRRIRCPRCGTASELLSFFVFDQYGYEDQTHQVFKCRAKVRNPSTGTTEPCRCIFSPSETVELLGES